MSAIVILENDGTVSYVIGATLPPAPLAIDFPYFFATEILVWKDTGVPGLVTSLLLDEGTDYTLTGVPADDGFHSGSVELLNPTIVNCVVRIVRVLRTDKSSNFPENGPISIPGMNTLFSRLFSLAQDQGRAIEQLVTYISTVLPIERPPVSKTADYIVQIDDNGTEFNNAGAAGTVIFTLADGIAGLGNGFAVVAPFNVVVRAPTGVTIFFGDVATTPGGTLTSATPGNFVFVKCHSATSWYVQGHEGTWFPS